MKLTFLPAALVLLVAGTASGSTPSNQLTVRVRLADGSVKRVNSAPSETVSEVCGKAGCGENNGVAVDDKLETVVDTSQTLAELAIEHGGWLYLLKDPAASSANTKQIIERMKRERERAARGGGVMEVRTMAEFDNELKSAAKANALVVVDFHATWCGPCKQIAPAYKAMADEFPKAVFLKVDVDANKAAAQKYQVSSMPTFLLLKKGEVVDTLKGADENQLREKIRSNM